MQTMSSKAAHAAASFKLPAAFAFLSLAAAPIHAQLEFVGDTQASPFGLGSMGIAAADLDGDGDQDLVTGLHGFPSNTLGLWIRQPNGSLVQETLLPIPGRATEVRAADVDEDGDIDLVVSNFTPANSVSVYHNKGAGQYLREDHPVSSIPTRLTLADLTGDGHLDVAVSLRSVAEASVAVLVGSGTGDFGPPATYPVGLGPNDVAAGDLDGDGDLDLVSVDTDQNTVSVLLNQGSGLFGSATPIAVGEAPRRIAIGDVTGDQVPDLVVSNDLTAAVTCLHGDGTGAFPVRVDLPISLRGRDIILADLDQDGRLDIALGIGFIDHLLVLRGLGAGAFEPAVQFGTGYEPFSIVAADLDGDGDVDLASANDGLSGEPSLTVLDNQLLDAPGQPFCFGLACPCGNDDATAGCSTSTGSGALLSAQGSRSVVVDDLILQAHGVPAGQNGLLFMGPATANVPFADGLRCVAPAGVGLFRYPVRNSGPAGVLKEGPGIAATSLGFGTSGQVAAGQTWHFQAWFRDPAGPCGSGAGLSNGYTVLFVQ